MKTWKSVLAGVAGVALVVVPVAVAQAPAAALAGVHGKVINVAGLPGTEMTVQFTGDLGDPKDVKFAIIKPTDANGAYAVTDLKPGHYLIYAVKDAKFVDRMDVTVKAGEDLTVDFDMTRPEYMKNLTPEEKAQIEKYKASLGANKAIANLNSTLAAVRADLKTPTPNFDKDIADMNQAISQKPEEGILYGTLGDALAGSADHAAAEDRKAGKAPMSDADVIKQYQDAVDAYKKAIDLNVASKKPSVADQATMYNQMGIAEARAGKVQDAQTAYEAAAKLVPASAGMYYGNEAAVLYNASQTNASLGDGALAAAEKAIAADPAKPDPYYVKGQILLQKATVDPKTQKIVAPQGCVDAYQKYLELAPEGKYAASVQEVLTQLDVKIVTKYRAGGKK